MTLAERNKKLWHEVVILRAQLLDCQTTMVAQAEVIKAQRVNLDILRAPCQKLIAYRDRNMFNFQLEKSDDFIRLIRAALEGIEPEEK